MVFGDSLALYLRSYKLNNNLFSFPIDLTFWLIIIQKENLGALLWRLLHQLKGIRPHPSPPSHYVQKKWTFGNSNPSPLKKKKKSFIFPNNTTLFFLAILKILINFPYEGNETSDDVIPLLLGLVPHLLVLLLHLSSRPSVLPLSEILVSVEKYS